ncbi:beta-1,3-galactosyltransferase 1-like isoform X2 [Mercenaria mercenaria]|nr:beta-1,3-galactosyltransferase 1-like isoform X2 [Mercenaria mercenaria]
MCAKRTMHLLKFIWKLLMIIVLTGNLHITFKMLYSPQKIHTLKGNPTLNMRLKEVEKNMKLTLKKPLFVPVSAKEMQDKIFSIPEFPFLDSLSFVLEPKSDCSKAFLIALIHSSPYHFEQRDTIRQTWTNISDFSMFGLIQRVFLFGTVNNDILQKAILSENNLYGDILQGRFIDHYYNLSFNTMMGFKWLIHRCENVKAVMKADDDIVIDMFRFLNSTVLSLVHKPKQVFCYYARRPIVRDINSKWYIRSDLFIGKNEYPAYCEGKLVMMTFDVLPSLYSVALQTPYFFIEDVYMYGLVINRIKGLTFSQLVWGTHFIPEVNKAMECLILKKDKCEVFAVGVSSKKEMIELWNLFRQRYMTN